MPELDRTSDIDAKTVIERLLPNQEIRAQVLNAFADAILLSNQQGSGKWGVTLHSNGVALNVGGFYACWIKQDELYLSVMENSLPHEVTRLKGSIKWGGPFKRLTGSQSLYIPLENIPHILPLVQQAMSDFIVSTAAKYGQMGVRVEGAHSPGVLLYLQDVLGKDLPEPDYGYPIQTGHTAIWKVAPGDNAFLWEFCQQHDCILIGWPGLGDYTAYENREAMKQQLIKIENSPNAARITWAFAHDMKPGHIIVANKGNNEVTGIGVVKSDYLPPNAPNNPSTNEYFPNAHLVDWRVTQSVVLSQAFFGQVPPTVFRVNEYRWNIIKQAYRDAYPDDERLLATLESLGVPTSDVTLPPLPIPKEVNRILRLMEQTHNILLYGPPGTGKTWLVSQFAKAFTDADKTRFVTFHQSFAYEEFVEGLKPVDDGQGQILYRVMPGVFKQICRAAQNDPTSQYLLVIDEINRANIAKVLGELITLLEDDKRLGQDNELSVMLPYSSEEFGVPQNLYILGTMNTADRSIALLDLALRRRFTFVEMMPDASLLTTDVAGVNLQALLTRLNGRIAALLDREHQIGHSYLMQIEDATGLRFAWYHRVIPLLQEYFYHDGERLQAVLGKAFVKEQKPASGLFDAGMGSYDAEGVRFEIEKFQDDDAAFLEALQSLSGVAAMTAMGE